MKPRMELECQRCHIRLEHEAELEVYLLHMQVDHDTDEVNLDLVAVCECNTTMTFERSSQIGNTGRSVDYFHCPSCGQTGFVERGA